MYCQKCGNEISENAKFCTKCGQTTLQSSAENMPINETPNGYGGQQEQVAFAGKATAKNPDKKKLLIIIGLICVLAIGGIVAIIAVKASEKKQEDDSFGKAEILSQDDEDSAEEKPSESGSAPAESPAKAEAVDIWPSLPKIEHTQIHTFFSNFPESNFNRYDPSAVDVDYAIRFALMHEYMNYYDEYKANGKISEDWKFMIDAVTVEKNLERFLGLTNINHHSIQGAEYRDGIYYFSFGDGSPFFFAQVTDFYDNGDGTFTAYYDAYQTHAYLVNIYDDIDDWMLPEGTVVVRKGEDLGDINVFDGYLYFASYKANVRSYPPNSQGMKRYQLIDLKEVE